MLSKLKFIPMTIIALLLMMMVVMAAYTINDRQIDYDVALADTIVPTYTNVTVPFDQQHEDATSLPFTASAVIDIDGDGVEELFIGGGYRQDNGLFQYKDGAFIEIADLFVTHDEGVWLYMNSGGTFTGQKLAVDMNDNTTALSVAVADLNNDGAFDMYVSGYIKNELVEGLNIFNKEGYGGTSELFINNGDNTFTNETEKRGLQFLHNTFQGVFGDFEGDGDLDLIVAHDTGHIKTWVNDGNGYFTDLENPNSKFPSYPMGIAVADINNDGLTDYAFSNIGSTPPTFMVRGDLRDEQPLYRKWLSFVPNGKGGFRDNAEDIKIADYEFAWGMSYEDLNLDGREDLLVSQNFVTAPFHKIPFLRLPGRLFVQTEKGEMAEVGAEAGVVNRQYSIVPLTADFNADGRPDIVHINIAGKSQAFLSNEHTDNGYLKIHLPDTIASIGAKVEVELEDGSIVRKVFSSGEGLVSDSSHVIIAGLGKHKATSVKVIYINGHTQQVSGAYRNESVTFKSAN